MLDYCLHAGSENTVIYFKDNLYVIKTLKEFQYVDEYGKDQGANVRQKAKDITNLLTDDARLREERRSRASMRDRMVRGETGDFGGQEDELENENERRRRAQALLGAPKSRAPKEDDEMRRAIEASKRSLEDDRRRLGEERDLAKALALSEQEEAARKRMLQDSGALFDDQAQSGFQPQANGGGDLLIDFNAPQQQLQPQFTSFNPYLQQAQQQAQQEEFLRQQAEWNAMQQQQAQQEEWQRQQMLAQQQAQQQAQQEEWNRQQQAQQQLMFQQQQQAQQQQFLMSQQQMQSPLMAQPTGYGSNNPFAMMGGQAQQQQQPQQHLSPAPSTSPFPSNPSLMERPTPSPTLSATQQNTLANARRTPANDGANSHLANLIANRLVLSSSKPDPYSSYFILSYAGRTVKIRSETSASSVSGTAKPLNDYTPNKLARTIRSGSSNRLSPNSRSSRSRRLPTPLPPYPQIYSVWIIFCLVLVDRISLCG